MEQLQNQHLTIAVSSMGAELQSIKDAEGMVATSGRAVRPSSSRWFAALRTTLTMSTASRIICRATALPATRSLR